MASKAGAYVAVLAGGIAVYSAFEHKRIIDVLLMRPSTLPTTSTNQSGDTSYDTTGQAATTTAVSFDPNSYSGGVRDAVCLAAQQALNEPSGTYEYDEVRPYPSSLFGPPLPVKTDCSGFATLCYKAAGAPDPNGLGYSGQGYTGSLLLKGASTNTPNPGDLVFWSGPDHVAVYIGNGEIIEFGAPPAPIGTTVEAENAYHSQFLGYRSYLAVTAQPTSGTGVSA